MTYQLSCNEINFTNTVLPTLQSATATSNDLTTSSFATDVQQDQYWQSVPTVDFLTVQAHGINLFDNFQDKFYTQYVPYHYGGDQIVAPKDAGVFMINFSHFPGSYQPSGHFNFSRSRETFLSWNSSFIGTGTPVNLIVVARAINFLIITDGSAMLRFST